MYLYWFSSRTGLEGARIDAMGEAVLEGSATGYSIYIATYTVIFLVKQETGLMFSLNGLLNRLSAACLRTWASQHEPGSL